jgi:endonuclease/exonuclease/phosphatase family metal-dependent hydrolase
MPSGTGRRVLWLAAPLLGVVSAVQPVETAAPAPCEPRPVVERAARRDAVRPPQDVFTIGSLNIAGQERIAEPLVAWVRERGFDVVLLQEVGEREFDGGAFVSAVADRLGYDVAYAPANRFGETEMQGLAILSRDSLSSVQTYALDYHRLRFKSRCRIALAATVATPGGPVRIINVHLDTRINSKERVAQLAPVIGALGAVDGPQVVGGDFNTMDVRWWRTMWPFPKLDHQADAVKARMGDAGFHTPFPGKGRSTFKFLRLPVYLDWVYLKQLDAVDWSVDDVRYSDHRGVWTRVKIPANPTGRTQSSSNASVIDIVTDADGQRRR